MGKLHRVARTGMRSRDPAIRDIDFEQFVHVPHDDHIAIDEDDSLPVCQSTTQQGQGRSYFKFHQTECPVERGFVTWYCGDKCIRTSV